MGKPAPAEAVPYSNEILTPREALYVPASLDTHYMFCFDEREMAEITGQTPGIETAEPDVYIHMAGGSLSIAYNQAVIEEAEQPFSVNGSFAGRTGTVMPVLLKARMKPGVHSDVASERGHHVNSVMSGPVGCGYAEARPGISLSIAENITGIVDEAARLRPELFSGPEDYNFAHALGASHGRLAERPGFLTSGRKVVMTAAASGANLMLMQGKHTGRKGIINLIPGSTFRSGEAARTGLEAYNQDSWAVEEANDRIRDQYPLDPHEQQIAELIDTVGTMWVLGVDEITVRRPEGELQTA